MQEVHNSIANAMELRCFLYWPIDLLNDMLYTTQGYGYVATNLHYYIDGLVQGRLNSSALAMELRLSCTTPSICFCTCNMSWVHAYCVVNCDGFIRSITLGP